MRESQRLALRAGEIRTRLSELSGVADLTDELRSEIDTLRNKYGDVERRASAATIAEDLPAEVRSEGPEDREMRSLIDRANVGNIFEAALELSWSRKIGQVGKVYSTG